MEETPRIRERRRRRRLLAFLTLAMLVGSITTTAFSLAAFTSAAAASGSLAAGTVVITADGHTGASVDPVTFTISSGLSAMKPGDSATGKIVVQNAGNLDFTYGVTLATAANPPAGSTNTNDLAAALSLIVTRTAGNLATCPATPSGTVYSAGPGIAGTIFSGHALAATAQETLCLYVTWNSGANDNNYQGAGTTATFSFLATQS